MSKQVDDDIMTLVKMLADTAMTAAKAADKSAEELESLIPIMDRIDKKLDALAGGGFLKVGDDYWTFPGASDHPDPGAEAEEEAQKR